MKILFRAALFLLLSSVAAFGQNNDAKTADVKFVQESIPDGKAVVYIFRVNELAWLVPIVLTKNETLGLLPPGKYYPLFCEPGKTKILFTNMVAQAVTIDVVPGQSYYVKVSTAANLMGKKYQDLDVVVLKDSTPPKDLQSCTRMD